ncbi:aminoglycoside phosphotransferase [Streptomyces viridochromogenes DSM 40736]|uniref:Aminoglycoside phosphotransferase n=1 Tax=Streptomyces viridochromogenes (strain DSM 40736 / JCM 4977 / BCRC 1201 / Tue 494) TaxID=591159 RepID=D9X4R4_STRVT|nr:aminoglycoside phosphotransferase [Streptomyces viridochromogenes DSM 40736]
MVVVKRSGDPVATRAEAAGLRWLADTGTVRVPEVRGHDDTWLVVDRVVEGRPGREAAVAFRPCAGRSARRRGARVRRAATRRARGRVHRARPRCATSPAPTGRAGTRSTRVLPYLRRAVDQGTVRPGEASVVERLCETAAGTVPGRPEAPARLHGDLWSGNVLWGADGQVWLIDPAAHGGHRETDLAMLRLFGCPHLERVLDGYRERAPLADGWADRVGVHQLFPLLVHAVLFGRSYAEQALAAARAALAR